MKDEKEAFVNEVLMLAVLPPDQERKMKDLLFMKLYDYSLIRIENAEVAAGGMDVMEEAYRMFFIAKRVQGCSKRTIEVYKYVIDDFFRTIHKPLGEITTNDIRYFLALKKEKQQVSDTHIDNIRRTLNTFFNWMTEEEYIQKNPVLKVKKVRVPRYVKKAFRDIEIEKIRLKASEDLRDTALVEVLLSTGCRISEVSSMDRNDIDGDEIVVKGKGNKERIVYLNAKAKIALERYLKSRDDDNAALFVSKDKPHSRMKISGMGLVIRELGKAAGVDDVHPHRFRRTAATMALNRGMPIDQVQIMLGHSSIETTTIYATSAQETVKASHKKYVV